MIRMLHILSVGSLESNNIVRDALLLRRKCRLFTALSYRDLCGVPATERFEIAVLHQTLFVHELRISLEYVRRHWPSAMIVLVSAHPESINDSLYDEQVLPGLSQEAFLLAIEQLVRNTKQGKVPVARGPAA